MADDQIAARKTAAIAAESIERHEREHLGKDDSELASLRQEVAVSQKRIGELEGEKLKWLEESVWQKGLANAAHRRIGELEAERDALVKFKAYVHRRLDEAGVPTDPESPHKAEGCRIGGRLDIVLAAHRQWEEAVAICAALMQWQGKASSVISDISEPIKKCFIDRTMGYEQFVPLAVKWCEEHVDRIGLQLENDPTFSKAGHELLNKFKQLEAVAVAARNYYGEFQHGKLTSAIDALDGVTAGRTIAQGQAGGGK